MHIGIIGANGFIGSQLAETLSAKSDLRLSLFGRQSATESKTIPNYFSTSSLTNEQLKEIFSSVDLVYYLASASIPASTWKNPSAEIETNLSPFLNFLEIFSSSGVKKVVFISSAGTIYGPSANRIKEDADKRPFSPHGIIKFSMENFLEYYRRKYGLNYDIFRVSNVFGEGQNTAKGLGLINTFMENILRQGSVTVFGDGSNFRNYIYVKDVIRLLTLSINSDLTLSNVWNMASLDSFTINQVIDRLKLWLPVDFSVSFEQVRSSDNTAIDIDNSKLMSAFPGFTFTEFEQAVLSTFHHIKQQLSLSPVK